MNYVGGIIFNVYFPVDDFLWGNVTCRRVEGRKKSDFYVFWLLASLWELLAGIQLFTWPAVSCCAFLLHGSAS